MAEDRDTLIKHYEATRRELLEAIDGLSDALMTETTLDGWSIADHLMHLAFWDDQRASEVERISAGHASVLRMTGEQDEAMNELVTHLRRGATVEQARWELTASRKRLLDAIASATERAMDTSLYGEAGLASGHEAEHTTWILRWRTEKGV